MPDHLKVVNVLLNSAEAMYDPSSYTYTWKLPTELRNVVAVRPLRIEYMRPNGAVSDIVVNGVSIPIQLETSQGAFMNLNEYRQILNTSTDINIFYKLKNGSDELPAPHPDVHQDAYTYVLRPMLNRLQRFDVKLLDFSYQPITNASFVAVLSIYCLEQVSG